MSSWIGSSGLVGQLERHQRLAWVECGRWPASDIESLYGVLAILDEQTWD